MISKTSVQSDKMNHHFALYILYKSRYIQKLYGHLTSLSPI